ncbi:MAG: hypothetical protein GEV04_08305 [Actinophytocola sp.]|nr:hypothetical protein [Actinophytocola sp.]
MSPRDVAPTPTATEDRPRLIDPDARFAHLPRPSYDPDVTGVRTGAAVTLSLVGGALVALSRFGAWLRVTHVPFEGARPRILYEALGFDLSLGAWVAPLGAAAVIAARAWHRGRRLLRRTAHGVVLTAAAVTGVALLLLQGRIDDATAQAIERAGFFDLTVGVGWGAWAAVVGAAVLLLASACAALSASGYDERSR